LKKVLPEKMSGLNNRNIGLLITISFPGKQIYEGFEYQGFWSIPNTLGKRNFKTAGPTGRDEDFKISITQILIKRTVLQSSLSRIFHQEIFFSARRR